MNFIDTIHKIPVGYGVWLPAIIIAADQTSKWGATKLFNLPMNICALNLDIRLAGHHYEVSPILDLSMLCNPGISWGLMQGDSLLKRWILLAVAVFMVFFLYNAMALAKDWFSRLCLALVIGGAIGNGIDRALFGAVTDFLDASDIGFFYVFNIADAAITVGIIGLLLTLARDMLAERKAKGSSSGDNAD